MKRERRQTTQAKKGSRQTLERFELEDTARGGYCRERFKELIVSCLRTFDLLRNQNVEVFGDADGGDGIKRCSNDTTLIFDFGNEKLMLLGEYLKRYGFLFESCRPAIFGSSKKLTMTANFPTWY